ATTCSSAMANSFGLNERPSRTSTLGSASLYQGSTVAPRLLRRNNAWHEILEVDSRRFRLLEEPARAKDLDAHELLACREVESDVVREPDVPALELPLEQSDVERVRLAVVGDPHRFAPS